MVKGEIRAAVQGLRRSTEKRNARAETLGSDGGQQTRKPVPGGAVGLIPHLDPIDLENRILQNCKTVFTDWSPSKALPQAKYLEKVLIQNQEKSFGRSLHVPISNIWRLQLRPQPPNQELTRHSAYVTI